MKPATFAGGCFWCMELPFDKIEGVVSTTTGYTGCFAETRDQPPGGLPSNSQEMPVPPSPLYPLGFLARYCW